MVLFIKSYNFNACKTKIINLAIRHIHRQAETAGESPLQRHLNKGDSPPKTDILLWEEFQSGSEKAYADIYKTHAAALYNYGLKLVSDPSLVKDCIQDLFIEIWDARQNLGVVRSIRSYLYKSIRRKILAEKAKVKPLVPSSDNYQPFEIAYSTERILHDHQIKEAQLDELRKALNKLTTSQREIIFLKYYDRLSYEEVADIMGISRKAAYKKIGRALHTLRQHTDKVYLLLYFVGLGLL